MIVKCAWCDYLNPIQWPEGVSQAEGHGISEFNCQKCTFRNVMIDGNVMKSGEVSTITQANKMLQPRTERHYDQAIQPIDYITANNLDFLHGNVIKYVSRWQGKDGLRDLDKAMDYLQRIIKLAKEGYYGEEYKSPD